MTTEIKVPELPESVTEATVGAWSKSEGDSVSRDENILELETDKVMLEVPSPTDGVLKEIKAKEGDTVTAGDVLAVVEEGEAAEEEPEKEEKQEKEDKASEAEAEEAAEPDEDEEEPEKDEKEAEKEKKEKAAKAKDEDEEKGKDKEKAKKEKKTEAKKDKQDEEQAAPASPAARKLLSEHELKASAVKGSGRGGRITKADVQDHLDQQERHKRAREAEPPRTAERDEPEDHEAAHEAEALESAAERTEQRVPMTRIRKRIAERLVEAQQTAAILTTFNEVDLKAVSDMRKRYKEQFEKENDVRLGFMSFFVRASIEALRRFPIVNASIDGEDIVYHGYYDIGIAVSSPRGLVVPVLRNADQMSFAQIEKTIADLGKRAKDNKLTMDDLTGGTFSITNGGVFGSMLSTPILNPPQSAILGMHAINERPVVVDGEIEIRPMMFTALSYDHRIIDGRDAVLFLRTITELLEDPARLLLQI